MQRMVRALATALILAAPANAHAQADSIASADSSRVRNGTILKAAAFTSAYYASSLVVLGRTWYRDRSRVPFHFYDDGRAYLQVDKLGHAFGAYVYSYAGYHYLLSEGLTREEALLFGATLGFVLQAPIEIMDGMHAGYGFSWADMAANAFGSGVVLGQELLFGEQIVKQKFSYSESSYARNANGYLGKTALDRLFNDYNGHTYWLSLPANQLLPGKRVPGWLNVAAGYGANGMYGEFENVRVHDGVALPEAVRYRQFLLSLDVDWTRVTTDSRALRTILKGLAFVKLPFPAVEYNSIGQWKGYWLYM